MSRKSNDQHAKLRVSVITSNGVLSDSYATETCPTLLSILQPIFEGDKCLRLGGTLRLAVSGGYYVVNFHCPTEMKKTTVIVSTLDKLVERLEDALRSPTTCWLDDYEREKKARQQARG